MKKWNLYQALDHIETLSAEQADKYWLTLDNSQRAMMISEMIASPTNEIVDAAELNREWDRLILTDAYKNG